MKASLILTVALPRFRLAGGVVRPNLAKWNLSSNQWETLGGTVIHCNGAVTSVGLESRTIMVTAIDPNGGSIGVAANGVSCTYCTPVGMINSEAFYTVESGGSVLRGQCRSVLNAPMRAVLGNIAGHGQITPPYLPATFRYTGLSQLGDTGWQVFATGGAALPPSGGSPYWPASTYVSGWKVVGDVNSIISYGENIFFGGNFDTLSGSYPATPPPYIADYSPFNSAFVWNQSSGWSKLANASGIPCAVPGALGVNGTIHAMDVDYSLCTGDLLGVWVGGDFSQAGGGAVSNIAFYSFWNGNPSVAHWDVPPAPSITAPMNGQMFPPGTSVGVLASFQVSGCSVSGVEFYEGKRLLASFTSPPFSFVWGPSIGTHTITAVATDSNGRIAVSQPVTFRVNAPPTVTLTSPANGAVFTAPANVSLKASASDSDPDGSVAKVEFFANGVLVATDMSSPYSTTWTGVSAGSYSIVARATDNNGAQTTSAAAAITVQ